MEQFQILRRNENQEKAHIIESVYNTLEIYNNKTVHFISAQKWESGLGYHLNIVYGSYGFQHVELSLQYNESDQLKITHIRGEIALHEIDKLNEELKRERV